MTLTRRSLVPFVCLALCLPIAAQQKKILVTGMGEEALRELRTAAPSAQIVGVAFKQICGRIAVFIGNDPSEPSFYDFIILPDGSWFAWGV